MKEYSTNWTRATTNPAKAIKALISCLQAGHVAFIVKIDNKDTTYPINMKNPALDLHENWTMAYGVPFDKNHVNKKNYFNATEEDLTRNYIFSFDHYRCINRHLFIRDKRKRVQCPMCGVGLEDCQQECRPVKLEDPGSRTWVTAWKPKDDIPYWIDKEMDQKVYSVGYYNKLNEAKLYEKLLYFLYSPLKLIPQKQVFDYGHFKTIKYRIGGVSSGICFEIQIPKRFSFNQ